jgi:hypothetical protein
MLIVETIAKIRLAYFSRKMTIKAICRDLRVSRHADDLKLSYTMQSGTGGFAILSCPGLESVVRESLPTLLSRDRRGLPSPTKPLMRSGRLTVWAVQVGLRLATRPDRVVSPGTIGFKTRGRKSNLETAMVRGPARRRSSSR